MRKKLQQIGYQLFTVLIFSFILNTATAQYHLIVHLNNKDTSLIGLPFQLKQNFKDSISCYNYVKHIPKLLFENGFPAASVDSVINHLQTTDIWLYTGNHYKGIILNENIIPDQIREASGIQMLIKDHTPLSFNQLNIAEENIITYLISKGYPFALVRLENPVIHKDYFSADLIVEQGKLYHIDSVRQYGKLKIKRTFLQHYLGVSSTSNFNIDKLNSIRNKLNQLPYANVIQKPDFTMLGTGAILNVYLDPKKASQYNILLGLIPSGSSDSKTRITGDIDLNLKNMMRNGETFILNWQQLQKQSPRLNIEYQQPYLFNSDVGTDLYINIYKKDSSYIQLNGGIAINYQISSNKTAGFFLNLQRSYLLQGGYDTNQIKQSGKLPQNIDFSSNSLGLTVHTNTLDYLFNARKGIDAFFLLGAGLKKINANNDIINLKDPITSANKFKSVYDSLNKNNYLFRLQTVSSKYLPMGKRSVLKFTMNAAWLQSPHSFKNELYLLGGAKLLRGFDEESIYADQYAILSTEYRYLTGLNSYLFLFNDLAVTHTSIQDVEYSNNFVSAGLGVSFETKAGILNITYAVGKRNDVPFNLSSASKIHFGFINYF